MYDCLQHCLCVFLSTVDVEFRLSFLPVVQLFPDTISLQDEVYKE